MHLQARCAAHQAIPPRLNIDRFVGKRVYAQLAAITWSPVGIEIYDGSDAAPILPGVRVKV